MANFVRTQIDAVWITGYQPPASDFEDLDRKCFQGINGTVGGTYGPSSVITVTGSGLALTGPLQIRGTGKLTFSTGATLTLGDSDYQDLAVGHPGRTRTIYQAMVPFRVVGEDHFAVTCVIPTGAAQPLASAIRRSVGIHTPEFVKELRVHDGAKLARVRLRFKVSTPHASLPQKMPKIRLFRVKNSDGAVSHLSSTTSGDGFVYITAPASGSAWHANGAVQEFVITPDQNHVIDAANYSYFAQIVEEEMGVFEFPFLLDVFEAVTVDVASTVDNAGFVSATVDGTPLWGAVAAAYALFKDQTTKTENGLYVRVGGGAWSRATTLNNQAQFRNGMLFEVRRWTGVALEGKATPGSLWQMTLPPPFVLGASNINFAPPTPNGVMYLGMVTEFEDIASTKFQ